ncbi:MAG TPA: YncE family protein [Ignavibacteria bacterium]|nr:YncE family protein [Ignavibacteria bacterium]
MTLIKFFMMAVILYVLVVFTGCKNDNGVIPTALDINYDAVYVVNGEDASLSIIEVASNTVKATIQLAGTSANEIKWPHHIYLNPAKTKLAIGVPGIDLSGGHGGHGSDTSKGRIVILDAQNGSILLNKITPHINHNAIFSPDGSEIWSAMMSASGKVFMYSATTYLLKDSITVGSQPSEVTFSADGSIAFVANGGSDDVTAINVSTKTVITTLIVGANPVGAWTGTNNKMYVDNEEGMTISVIDVASLQVEETVNLGFKPGFAAYNQQTDELWVTDGDGGRVVYFHRMNNQWEMPSSIAVGAGAHAIAFTNDGSKAYITNQMANTVSVIDVLTHTKIMDIPVGRKPNGLLIRYIN